MYMRFSKLVCQYSSSYKSVCSVFLLTIFPFFTSAQAQLPEAFLESISVSYKNTPAKQVLSDISEKQGVKFKYRNEWLEGITLTYEEKETTVYDFLNNQFKQYGLSFLFREPAYAIMLKDGSESINFVKSKPDVGEVISLGKVQFGLEEATLSGTVNSGESGERIPGVTISVTDENIGTTTNQNGEFSLVLPTGYHLLQFNSLETREIELAVLVNSSGRLNMSLFRDYQELNEVVVSAKAPEENVKETITGTERITLEEIEKMPAFLGEADVIKTITTLPGVNTAGEAGGGFNVRGSGVGANLVLLDEGVIFNTSHLFGLFTVFSADAVQSAELFKGTVPAPYGGRSGSILKTEIKAANKYKFIGKGGVGLISSRMNLEIPILKSKSSLLTNVRAAYPNYILNQVNNDDLENSRSFFGDATVKYDHKINENNHLSITGYGSDDSFAVNGLSYLYSNYIASLSYSHSFDNASTLNVGYSYNLYESTLIDEIEEEFSYQLNNRLNNNRLKLTYSYDMLQDHQLSAGLEVNNYRFSPGTFSAQEGSSVLSFEDVDDEAAVETAVFIDDKVEVMENLSVYAGLRYSYYSGGKPDVRAEYQGFEPRVSLNFSINSRNSIKMGYNRMFQYIHLISNTAAITPIDIWKLSNQDILPTSSNQYSIGYFKNFSHNTIESSVEVFYKHTDDLVEYKNGAQLFANNNIEDELLQGEGEAYGLEFYLNKNKGLFTGFLSYTFSRSLITVQGETEGSTINDGEQFPTNFDQPHNLGLFANYQFSRLFDMSLNFTYNTGRAITYPTTRYRYYGVWLANYTERNSERIPDYHRLDLSFHISPGLKKNKKYESSWTFTLYNLYSRRNAYSIYFKPSNAYNQLDGYRLSIIGRIIPSVSYNFKF